MSGAYREFGTRRCRKRYTTRYAHMSHIEVAVGDAISGDEIVETVGSTGNSTGAHLHYEVRRDDHPFDPACFLPR